MKPLTLAPFRRTFKGRGCLQRKVQLCDSPELGVTDYRSVFFSAALVCICRVSHLIRCSHFDKATALPFEGTRRAIRRSRGPSSCSFNFGYFDIFQKKRTKWTTKNDSEKASDRIGLDGVRFDIWFVLAPFFLLPVGC